MRKAVVFDEFAYVCQYFTSNTDLNNGYGCTHPEQTQTPGCCFCCSCPLGIEAEQADIDNPIETINWDGLCEDGIIWESEYLLINCGEECSADEKEALRRYDEYMHRYDFRKDKSHG